LTAESIAHQLSGRKAGDSWLAKCPAHEDRNPSLAIRQAGDKVLVCCHAGCRNGDVIAALKDLGVWESQSTFDDRIVAEYGYTDEKGQLLYQVVRLEPKSFRQRYPDGRGGWTWKKHPHQVLYHLREVLEAPIVFIAEGEKDAETLRAHGFVASTNAGGANAPWLPQFTEALRGREVILIPDRDTAGYERVKRIARALFGNVARLVYLELEDGKDVTEWFERHSELEFIEQFDGEAVSK
jgi:putative DNA primase/helicase